MSKLDDNIIVTFIYQLFGFTFIWIDSICFHISRKISSEGKTKKFRIRQNQNGNKVAIDWAIISGTCCWKMCERFGNCDTFSPGQEGEPPRFIYSILAADC